MASKAQQKEWLALFEDAEGQAPTGYQVKQWLFGGQSIATKVALFPLHDYSGQIVTDLFGEDGYFADTDLFWQKQSEAVAAKRDALLAAGWGAVEVLETGERFSSWEYEKTPKKKGGKVFITVSHRGEVEIHEGWLSRKEARRSRRAGDNEADPVAVKPVRPEVTNSLQTYIDLHRHAAVRTALLDHPGAALRLMVAHAIAGSSLWQVSPDRHPAVGETIAASLAASPAQAAFADRCEAVRRLLDLPDDHETIAHGNGDAYAAVAIFVRLLALADDDVLRVLAIVMGETLEAGSALVEAVGVHLRVDMGQTWKADDAFFDLIRDRAVINAMVADVAGKQCADGNIAEKVKTQKQVIRDCLAGENGRVKAENWLPGWMAFPVRAYTDNGLKTAEEWARVSNFFEHA
jgi:ParB family chromosome partitioning protein